MSNEPTQNEHKNAASRIKPNLVWIIGLGAIAAFAIYFFIDELFAGGRAKPFTGPASTTEPNFVDRTADFGITVSHRQGDDKLTGLDESLGSGACALDYDNDGWIDMLIVNGSGDTRYYGRPHWWLPSKGHRLLRNIEGRHFEDVTESAKLGIASHGIGCVAADLDNDGDSDLLITNVGSNLLLRNNGDGTFTDVTRQSGMEGDGWHTAAAVADVDGDGLLDLYVGRFINFEKGSRTYEPGSQFKQDTSPLFNSALYSAQSNVLYRNKGNLQFEDVTASANVADADGRTLAAMWIDVNEDDKPDLIVVNAAGTGSTTGFLNRGDWHFEPLGLQARIESGASFHGIAAGDLDSDGAADLVLTGATGGQTVLLLNRGKDETGSAKYLDQARPWTLAQEKFSALMPWGLALTDFNNDGWLDVFIANGQILPDTDTPHVTVGQPKQLWLNAGNGSLRESKPSALSPLSDRQSGRGVVAADFNNDGKVDLYVTHNNDVGQLLINNSESTAHWIGIKLKNDRGNGDAVGARITVSGDLGGQTRWMTKGAGFLSDSDPRVHFGFGTETSARISVRWPNGSVSTYRHVSLDRYVTISQSGGITQDDKAAHKPVGSIKSANDTPEARLEFIRGVAAIQDVPNTNQALQSAVSDPSEAVRLGAIQALNEQRSATGLAVLLRFLEDSNEAVVASALDAVCSFQEEAASRYLLRMFAHSSATVRAKVATCFAGYFESFQVQQAVIHRKYLAVPYLVSALNDPDRQVQIAAARALGASERFRGVPPLIELLNTKDTELQAESIRALGLIRDRFALPALLELADKQNVEPAAYAQLFIALKRLNYDRLKPMMSDFAVARGKFSHVDARKRLASFLAVLDSPEGVVLDRETIQSLATTTYRASSKAAGVAEVYCQLAAKSGMPDAAATVAALLKDPNPKIRAQAYAAQFKLQPQNRDALIAAALKDSDSTVRVDMLHRIVSEKHRVPDTVLIESLKDEQTRLDAVRAIGRAKSDTVVAQLNAWVLDETAPTELRIAALSALDRSNYAVTLPESWHAAANDDVRIALLNHEAAKLPPIFVSKAPPPFIAKYLNSKSPRVRRAAFDFLCTREELWAKQLVVGLLKRTEEPLPLRRHVLENLPKDYLRNGGVLLDIASNSADPLRLEALHKLYGTTDEQTIQALIAIARNEKEDSKIRLLAAGALPIAQRNELLPPIIASTR